MTAKWWSWWACMVDSWVRKRGVDRQVVVVVGVHGGFVGGDASIAIMTGDPHRHGSGTATSSRAWEATQTPATAATAETNERPCRNCSASGQSICSKTCPKSSKKPFGQVNNHPSSPHSPSIWFAVSTALHSCSPTFAVSTAHPASPSIHPTNAAHPSIHPTHALACSKVKASAERRSWPT